MGFVLELSDLYLDILVGDLAVLAEETTVFACL